MIRSYHREYISSRLITEIKHDWAATVVPTEMGCEVAVTNLLLVKHSFNNSGASCVNFRALFCLSPSLLKRFHFCEDQRCSPCAKVEFRQFFPFAAMGCLIII